MRARHSTRAEMVHFGRVEAHISEDLKRFTYRTVHRSKTYTVRPYGTVDSSTLAASSGAPSPRVGLCGLHPGHHLPEGVVHVRVSLIPVALPVGDLLLVVEREDEAYRVVHEVGLVGHAAGDVDDERARDDDLRPISG